MIVMHVKTQEDNIFYVHQKYNTVGIESVRQYTCYCDVPQLSKLKKCSLGRLQQLRLCRLRKDNHTAVQLDQSANTERQPDKWEPV